MCLRAIEQDDKESEQGGTGQAGLHGGDGAGEGPWAGPPLATAGERGELCIRGPQVMLGYLDAPDKTAACLDADGWLRTGDVAVADGCITLLLCLLQVLAHLHKSGVTALCLQLLLANERRHRVLQRGVPTVPRQCSFCRWSWRRS